MVRAQAQASRKRKSGGDRRVYCCIGEVFKRQNVDLGLMELDRILSHYARVPERTVDEAEPGSLARITGLGEEVDRLLDLPYFTVLCRTALRICLYFCTSSKIR